MDNKFIPQAIDIVTQAIELDNREMYDDALVMYKKALEYFMIGLKYEKNPTTKEIITKRIEGYMARAEQLSDMKSGKKPATASADGGGGEAGSDDEEGGDDEKKKLRGALASAVVSEKPNVKWDDVAGLELAKEALKEAVILPARFPQLFTGKRRPWKGILLYGPPGTGKSYLAKAVATEADATFFSVSSSDLVSKWQGESERLVKNLFEMARENKPAIIFIDEIDSLCSNRSEGESDSTRRIKTEFLVQMQGVGNSHDGILVLGATNVPWELDPAMRRRFEKRIYIPLPEAPARGTMLKIHLGDTPTSITPADFDELAEKTEGSSGSDISVVVREALMEPLRHCQQAKFWQRCNQDTSPNPNGAFVTPCVYYPPCAYCHPQLSTCPPKCQQCNAPCPNCGSIRMRLYDLPEHGFTDDKMVPPVVSMRDFRKVLEHSVSSVAEDELTQFIKWTEEFGQEG